MLSLTWRQVAALRKRWRKIPPLDLALAIIARWRPPTEIIDLPDGAFDEAAEQQADWFKNPERFFAPGFGATVSKGGDG